MPRRCGRIVGIATLSIMERPLLEEVSVSLSWPLTTPLGLPPIAGLQARQMECIEFPQPPSVLLSEALLVCPYRRLALRSLVPSPLPRRSPPPLPSAPIREAIRSRGMDLPERRTPACTGRRLERSRSHLWALRLSI